MQITPVWGKERNSMPCYDIDFKMFVSVHFLYFMRIDNTLVRQVITGQFVLLLFSIFLRLLLRNLRIRFFYFQKETRISCDYYKINKLTSVKKLNRQFSLGSMW